VKDPGIQHKNGVIYTLEIPYPWPKEEEQKKTKKEKNIYNSYFQRTVRLEIDYVL
jgi:hypothetical protein